MSGDATIQFKPVLRPPAGCGFENGEIVPVTPAPEMDSEPNAPELDTAERRAIAFQIQGEYLLMLLNERSPKPGIAALLVILYGYTPGEMAQRLDCNERTITRAVKDARLFLSNIQPFEVQGVKAQNPAPNVHVPA